MANTLTANARWRTVSGGASGVSLAAAGIGATFYVAGSPAWYGNPAFVLLSLFAGLILGVIVPYWQWGVHERAQNSMRFTNRLLAGIAVDPQGDEATGISDLRSALRVYNATIGCRYERAQRDFRWALEDVLAGLESRDFDALGVSRAVSARAIDHAVGTLRGFLREMDGDPASSAGTPDDSGGSQ